MDYATFIHCRIPRIRNAEGQCRTIDVSWAEAGISHSKKFENKCISTLTACGSNKKCADLMGISDDKVSGIMHKAVERGLQKRDLSAVRSISLDEKSYAKGHVYMSVLTNAKTGTVLDVERDRTKASADKLLNKTFDYEQLRGIQTCCCDLWDAFTNALKKTVRVPLLRTISFT
jgi:transposase